MRLFETLDKMNQMDADNGSANVGIYNEVIAVDKFLKYGKVTIGVSPATAEDLALNRGNKRAILLIIDMDAFNKIDNK